MVLDDGSTDDTARVCRDAGATVHTRDSSGFWGTDETSARAQLWDLAAAAAGPDGWIYFADGDHELRSITQDELLALCKTTEANAISFPLCDCWDSDTLMREDAFWRAHLHPRVWLVRALPEPGWKPNWVSRGIHAGHIPPNYPIRAMQAPSGAHILHLGYINPEHRLTKAQKYLSLSNLSAFERAHAQSILDPTPHLVPTPGTRVPKILIASVVRKPRNIIEAFLRTIRAQRLRASADLGLLLVPNLPTQAEYDAAFADLDLDGVQVASNVSDADGYGDGPDTRHWTPKAWHRVGAIKDDIIQHALASGADYLFLVDTDVLCGPETLQSLLDSEAPIVSAVYWTQWRLPKPGEAQHQHAGPQVWLRHPYELSGRGYTEAEFRAALISRERLEVGGLGAVTLFRRDALEKGIRFAPFGALPPGPMSDGEDRHLCARASALHIPLIADPWPDVFHAYHPAEYDTIEAEIGRFAPTPEAPPAPGDLVSFTVQVLEPVQDSQRVQMLRKQWVRGRLGSLPVLPEVELALAELRPGERRIVRLHYPAHHAFAPLRGKIRTAEVTLLDHKPFRLPPTIVKELLTTPLGTHIDVTTLTEAQIDSLTEVA